MAFMAYAMNIGVLIDILLSYYDPAALHLSPTCLFLSFRKHGWYIRSFLNLSLLPLLRRFHD